MEEKKGGSVALITERKKRGGRRLGLIREGERKRAVMLKCAMEKIDNS